MTFQRLFVVPEVLLSQVVPLSVDVRMVPELPTATKVLFAKVIPLSVFVVPEVFETHVLPLSEEV